MSPYADYALATNLGLPRGEYLAWILSFRYRDPSSYLPDLRSR
jgi:hypothetical protein